MKQLKFLETKRTPRYSLRKLNVGVASILLGVTIFGINFTNHSVKAATIESVENFNSSANSNSQQTKGINAIGAVKVPSLTDSQNDANKAIDDALNNKKSEINGATTIDQTTKDKLNQAATDAADKAKEAINKATTNNDVATEQTNTQKATSASNNAIANNSTEATQTSSTKAKQTTQTATKNSDNTKVSSNTTNKENSQPTDKTTNTQVVSNIDKTLASLLNKLLATTPTTDNSASDSSTLPKSDQTVTKVDPMMSDYLNRGGKNTWIDQTVAPGWFGKDYAGEVETAIFGDKGIIKQNSDKYFFAGYADFSEGYHRIILFARGQDAGDKNLYTYVVHTHSDNVQRQTEKTNETAPEIEYGGLDGSTYNLQVHNYNGESFSVVIKGFKDDGQGGYGLTPIFDQGILNPKYKDKTEDELDGKNGINYKEHIGSWDSVIPQETTTSVRYVDLETGKDIAQPLMVTGYRYQGVKINGDAPKIDGYTLVSGPKTLGLSYEDGIIAPYKVGQTYTQYFTDDVYVKQTVIDTNGTVRATAYYKGQPLGASASKILGHNDSMSFKAGGQGYTYNNRINDVDGAMVYYYQKVGEEGKSQLRVHYIDVTKDTDDSQYAPGDGVPATDPISGQEMNPLTYTGNIGHTYDYATTAKAPEGYVLVGTSPNLKGTFSKSDHDAYIYVKIDRNGAKATIENLTHLNNAQKQAAEAAIDQATDLNTITQAKQDASTLDRAMGTLKQAITDGEATHGTVAYDEADPDKKSTLDNAIKNGQAVTDATNGSNADLTTVKDLSQAIENAQTGLNGDSNLAKAKDQADQNIAKLPNLSDGQKDIAKQNISNAQTTSDVQQAEQTAKTWNDNLGKLNQAISAANSAKSTPNYTEADSGQQKALDDALSEAEKAKNSNDPSAVGKATTDLQAAQSGLNGDSNLAKAKDQADQNIDDVAKAAKQAIDNTNGITDSEKQAAKGQVDADANAAKEAIANADSTKAVTDAVNNGTVAINKDDANAAIDGALAEKNNSIEDAPNLTTEEKQAVKEQAKTDADNAKTAISNAKTVTDVESAKNTGVETINNIKVPTTSATKDAAINTINTALSDKKKAINGTNLTNEEKSTLVSQAQKLADDAIANINKATTNDAVKTAKENGVEKINNIKVPATSATKDSAKNAIDQAAKAKNDAIDASNLTAEEKADLKKQVAGEVQKANAAIDAATKNADVKTAQTAGEQAINAVEIPASVSKTDAINAINAALTDKKAEINGTNLTAEEKTAVINKAQKLADAAIANINKATTNDAVNTAKENGVQAIKNMTIPTVSDVKKNAKNAIDQAAKQAIDNTNGLTDSEKQAAKSQVDTDAKAAKEDIDKADFNDAVTNAVNNGTVAINKDAANAAIDGALVKKNNSIDAAPNLTDEEKQSVKNQAQTVADSAKTDISKASTVAAVESAKNTGVDNINKVSIPAQSKAKAAAIAEIYAELNKKLDAINNNLVLVTEEKDALTNEANTAADKAKDAINKAASNADVESEEDKGITNIQNVDNPAKSQVKEADKAAVQAVADSKINAIDNAPNLTAEEKAELVKQVNDIASNAKVNIDNSSSSQSVETVRDNGISDIKAVEIPKSSKTKNDANSDLDKTADAANQAIDKTSGLTADQKQTAKDQIEQAVTDAKENINNASDNKGVANATDAGKLAIDKVSTKAAIGAAVAAKKSKIAKTPLTAEESKLLNNLVDQEADAAKDAIDAATTNAVVEAAKNNGVETINNINVPATFATKDDANKAIADALAKKIEEINNANLTDDQKQSLIDQAQNAANQAKENVRSASTDEDVQTAKNNGIAAINGITVKSNSVDDQDNSATNEGNGNQAGHIQSDNSSDVTKHSSTQQSGNEKDKLPQTGNEIQRGAGLVGLAIAGLAILLGSAGFRKKRD